MRGAEWLIAQSPDLNVGIEAIVVEGDLLEAGCGPAFRI